MPSPRSIGRRDQDRPGIINNSNFNAFSRRANRGWAQGLITVQGLQYLTFISKCIHIWEVIIQIHNLHVCVCVCVCMGPDLFKDAQDRRALPASRRCSALLPRAVWGKNKHTLLDRQDHEHWRGDKQNTEQQPFIYFLRCLRPRNPTVAQRLEIVLSLSIISVTDTSPKFKLYCSQRGSCHSVSRAVLNAS